MTDATVSPPKFETPLLEAIFWRGVFLHRYAGVEHSLTELLARAHNRAEYVGAGDVPFRWKGRLTHLAKLLDQPGPLKSYEKPLRAMLEEFSLAERYRHMFVHGIMSCGILGDNQRSLHFRSHHWEAGKLHQLTLDTTVDLLRGSTMELGPLATQFTTLVAHIFEEEGLSARPTSEPKPIEIKPRDF